MATISIRGNVLNPNDPGSAGVQLPSDASGTNHVLVQLSEPLNQDLVERLETARATLVKRMTGNTWLVDYPPADLSKLTDITGVQNALVYSDHFVVQAKLKESSADTASLPVVAVVLHETARPSSVTVLDEIRNMGGTQITSANDNVIHVQLSSAEDLERIAAIDGVQAIEEAPQIEAMNDRIMEISGLNHVNELLTAAHKTALTGAGQSVAVADTGVDIAHEAFKAPNKIIKKYHVAQRDNTDDDNGHGTHVAGTVLGGPVQNWEGKDITGLAHNARLNVQGILFAVNANWTSEELFDDAYSEAGGSCRVHNNSWGASLSQFNPQQIRYGAVDAERIDKWAIDHPDFLIVRAAGNDGRKKTPTGAQVSSYATSKNVLTVGATYTDRPTNVQDKVDYSPGNVATYKSKKGQVAPFSSRGPVMNTKRTKPDVVAPGVCILSYRTQSRAAASNQQNWENGFGEPNGGFKTDDKFIFCSGTSMASPAVSGYAALLREALKSWRDIAAPSAPLMKALFINGTDDLGISTTIQGFGEINLDKVFKPVAQSKEDVASGAASAGFAEGTAERRASPVTFTTTVPTASQNGKKVNLSVVMVYHDAPGETIQNYMNLFVQPKAGERKDSYTPENPENVHRHVLTNLTPGDTVTIGVEPKLIAIGNVPWGLVWNHFES